MTFNLPNEIWLKVFSYLELEELGRARRVCKLWWELINTDSLWKPLLLERRITLDSVKLDNNGTVGDGLTNCQWAHLCFSYYSRMIHRWENFQCKRSKFPRSTGGVAIRMPYVLRTFDPWKSNVLEVLQVVNGNLDLVTRLHLPVDEYDECYDPCMTSDNVFGAIKGSFIIIFKLKDGQFEFAKALSFLPPRTFASCARREDLDKFLCEASGLSIYLTCIIVTENIIWCRHHVDFAECDEVYVWNYFRSELLQLINIEKCIFVHAWRNYVYLTHRETCRMDHAFFEIYNLSGEKLWRYEGPTITSVCWNKFGCSYIETNLETSIRKAVFLEMPNSSRKTLEVDCPISVTLHTSAQLAYCLCFLKDSVNLICFSMEIDGILWDTIIYSGKPTNFTYYSIRMTMVLGKFIAIEVDENFGFHSFSSFVSSGSLSLYSISCGDFIQCNYIGPFSIHHISDEFVLTRIADCRGARRFQYELFDLISQN